MPTGPGPKLDLCSKLKPAIITTRVGSQSPSGCRFPRPATATRPSMPAVAAHTTPHNLHQPAPEYHFVPLYTTWHHPAPSHQSQHIAASLRTIVCNAALDPSPRRITMHRLPSLRTSQHFAASPSTTQHYPGSLFTTTHHFVQPSTIPHLPASSVSSHTTQHNLANPSTIADNSAQSSTIPYTTYYLAASNIQRHVATPITIQHHEAPSRVSAPPVPFSVPVGRDKKRNPTCQTAKTKEPKNQNLLPSRYI